MSWKTTPGAAAAAGAPPGYDTEVAAAGDLKTALEGNTSVYLSGDVTISATIALAGNYRRLKIKPGVVITLQAAGLGAGHAITLTAGGALDIDCDGNYSVDARHTGSFIQGGGTSAKVNGKGEMTFDQSNSSGTPTPFKDISGSFDRISMTLRNTATTLEGSGGVGSMFVRELNVTGAGTSTSLILEDVASSKFRGLGTWRPYSTSMASDYAVKFNALFGGTVIEAVEWATAVQTIGLWATSLCRVESVSNAAGGTPIHVRSESELGMSGGAPGNAVVVAGTPTTPTLYRSIRMTDFIGESASSKHFFIGVSSTASQGIENISNSWFIGGWHKGNFTLQSTASKLRFIGVQFETGDFSVQAGTADHEFVGCRFDYWGTNLLSGTNCLFTNCRFDRTFTIDSGAKALFVNCSFAVAPTNSDPEGTRFIGCTPQGFSNTTIDASIRYLTSYFRFDEASGSFRSSAPFNKDLVLSPSTGTFTYAATGIEGAGKGVTTPTAGFISGMIGAALPASPGAEFTAEFWYKPTDATPGVTARLMYFSAAGGSDGTEVGVYQLTTGELNVYAAGSIAITGTTVLADNTMYHVALVRRDVAGTRTWFLYINGTQEGTSTTNAATKDMARSPLMTLNGLIGTADGQIAIYSSVATWACALSAAQITARYNSGTGRFLSVVA